jgi:3-isopropylmalate/(R)-2-methylmalate dehydratase large subunit
MEPLKVRRIRVTGRLARGVYAKDVILTIIQRLGVKGGAGFAYEYAGEVVERMSMDERMTICNMSIEGARASATSTPTRRRSSTCADARSRRGRRLRPRRALVAVDRLRPGRPLRRRGDDRRVCDRADGHLGHQPGPVGRGARAHPRAREVPAGRAGRRRRGARLHGLRAGAPIAGTPIDVAFIGSCTNGRLSDLREARASSPAGAWRRACARWSCPGSERVRQAAEQRGAARVFEQAGFEWRGAGCSMCLAMNPDRLQGREICASSSNRNFKGRQGSPTGRTLLMSPAMVAAAAIAGEVVDVRGMARAGGGDRVSASRIESVSGRGLPLRGHDIDTDRIIPARFLRAVSFEGLERTCSRTIARAEGIRFDHPAYQGASVLVVNRNFGCGSSREHAPQAIQRWGIRAIVGEGYSEIFFGNAVQLGLPCLTASAATSRR